jgi:hypothetical protein
MGKLKGGIVDNIKLELIYVCYYLMVMFLLHALHI